MYDIDRPDLSEKLRVTRYPVTGSGNTYRRGDLRLPRRGIGLLVLR